MQIRKAAWILAGSMVLAAPAFADTTVKMLHIQDIPHILKAWTDIAREFEASHPGVTVDMQFLENEAFKAKLPTLLQSEDRPHIFYSWGGGVMQAQARAGVLQDVTAEVQGEFASQFPPQTVDAFTYEGKIYGAPMDVSQVGFWYNRELFDQAGLIADDIKTYDDLLGAVQTLTEAGITPIAIGGSDKWPVHFYWTHLAVRLGGKEGFDKAIAGEDGGFAGETFVRAGELLQQLAELEPFQDGWQGVTFPEASGHFGDGKAAMHLMGDWDYNVQRDNSVDKNGLSDEQLGWFPFPIVEGGQGKPTDTLGGITGWLIGAGAPPEAAEFLKFFLSKEHQYEFAAGGFVIPAALGSETALVNPFYKRIAQNIAQSDYHQVFYDQVLGPDVGRVVNDVSTDIAAGNMSPEEAAQAVQEAWEFN